MSRWKGSAPTTSSACSPIARFRSRSETSRPRRRSATAASLPTPSDRTRTDGSRRPKPKSIWPKAPARRSVSRVLSRATLRRHGDGHPSGAAGYPTAHAADPRAGQRTSPPTAVARRRVAPSYLALLRVEFARFTPSDRLRDRPASSLWHWSSPHGGRALPATLRCGARTFLTPSTGLPPSPTRDHPTASLTERFYAPGASRVRQAPGPVRPRA